MKIAKTYRLLRFLNRRHHAFFRISLAIIGYSGTLLVTFEPTLAKEAGTLFLKDQFKLAFRRCRWYATAGWPALSQQPDPFFDFTDGLTLAQLQALHRFHLRRQEHMAEHLWRADGLYIQAAQIHLSIDQSIEGVDSLVDTFYQQADMLLATNPAQQHQQVAPARLDDFSTDDAQAALNDIADALPNDQHPWYVMSGTFLGLYREGGFLAHDYDIDIGINAEQADLQTILQRLQSHPHITVYKTDEHWRVRRGEDGGFTLEKMPALIKAAHQTGINIDLFVHYLEDNTRWHGSVIHRWDNSEFALARYSLCNMEVFGPEDADRYLTENYGDWRTPVKQFDCTTGTPNLHISQNFLSYALFIKRLMVAKSEDRHMANKLYNTLTQAGLIKQEQGKDRCQRLI